MPISKCYCFTYLIPGVLMNCVVVAVVTCVINWLAAFFDSWFPRELTLFGSRWASLNICQKYRFKSPSPLNWPVYLPCAGYGSSELKLKIALYKYWNSRANYSNWKMYYTRVITLSIRLFLFDFFVFMKYIAIQVKYLLLIPGKTVVNLCFLCYKSMFNILW